MLTAFVSALHAVTRPVRFLEFSEEDGRESLLQHIAIIKAVKVHDRYGTEAALREHLTYRDGVAIRAPGRRVTDRAVEPAPEGRCSPARSSPVHDRDTHLTRPAGKAVPGRDLLGVGAGPLRG
jgi:hypothetical protein